MVIKSEEIDPILKVGEVRAAVSYSVSQIYRMIREERFPRPLRLGPGRVGWRRSAIVGWLAERPTTLP